MAHVKNYYRILQVDRSADEADIKAAFQSLARQYPDGNDPAVKELKEAYRVLTDGNMRRQYDRYLQGKITTGTLTQETDIIPTENGNGNITGQISHAAPVRNQMWEYLTLESSQNYGTTKYYVNGEMDPDLRNANFSNVINVLGSEGWDLVGISTVGTIATYVFKRATNQKFVPPEKGPAA